MTPLRMAHRAARKASVLAAWCTALVGCATFAETAPVTLEWDPSPDPLVNRYRLYYGLQSGLGTNFVEAQNQTFATVEGLTVGATYFFRVTALNVAGLESDPSGEFAYLIPAAEPGSNSPPRTPAVYWTPPAAIAYGTALGATELNAAADTPGAFAYDPPPGTVLHAGPGQRLSVVFTPADLTQFALCTQQVSIDVLKAALTIRADDLSMAAGSPVPALTATYIGLVNGDTPASLTQPVQLSTPANSSSPAGVYPIGASGAESADYAIVCLGGSLTVTAAADTPLVYTVSFINPGSIAIPSMGAASPYASAIEVSGLTGSLSNVTARIHRLTHSRPADLDVLLIGPNGQQIRLMSDAGGVTPVKDLTLSFEEGAAQFVPQSGPVLPGAYRPSNYGSIDPFPPPAASGVFEFTMASLNRSPANGPWTLCVVDDSKRQAGAIWGGWTLTLTLSTTNGLPPGFELPAPAIEPPAAPVASVRIETLLPATNGRVQLNLRGRIGEPFLLQASTNLAQWDGVEAGWVTNETFGVVDAALDPGPRRFYRVLQR